MGCEQGEKYLDRTSGKALGAAMARYAGNLDVKRRTRFRS
jgi:hypothetical protein